MIIAGIGSRETPSDILDTMYNISYSYAKEGHILRSGGAIGADTAFAKGYLNYPNLLEIYLAKDATSECEEIASKFHPAWNKCNPYVKKLHGRNALIILGKNLNTPADLVVCWTKNGLDVGGTGLSIRIAKHYNIKIRNLYNEVNKM